MNSVIKTDIAIIGAGAAGLSVAAGAAQMGAKVVLIEAGKMGGDCLNYGCVPSKALLAAAKTAQTLRNASVFGITPHEPEIDISRVMASVQSVIKTIAVHDAVERFEKMGVHVISGIASFEDRDTLKVDHQRIQARRFVIATGSSAAIPPIPGLDRIQFYTNETIFNLNENPKHLIIIGGGPISCELGQAFLLLGIKVTVLEAFHILPRDEQDLVSILRDTLIEQGLNLYEKSKILEVKSTTEGIDILIEQEGKKINIQGSHVLVAAGRTPNIKHLNLEAAGIQYNPKGIQVDARLRTSNRRVYALGDVVGPYQFTHIASYHAGIALRNILFRLPAKTNYTAVPWVTYTHPELAHVGLSSADALKQDAQAKILTWDFSENDRAQAEYDTCGKIKLITSKKGRILGVTIVGPQAGELLIPWISAIQGKKTVRCMTDLIVPYPTLSEINKRVAGEYYTPVLFSKRTRRLVWLLNLLG